MDLTAKRTKFFSILASILAGMFFLYASITIIGYSARFSMSFDLFHSLIKFSETLAFSLSGLLTIGVPLSVLFCLVAFFLKRTIGLCYPYLVVLPLVLLVFFGFFRTVTLGELDLKYIVLMFMQYLPLLLTVIFLSSRSKCNVGTKRTH
jgi:hypothetical protein